MKRIAVILLLVPAVLSCESVLEPSEFSGAWALQNTPIVLQAGNAEMTILADTLYIGSTLSTRATTFLWESEEATIETRSSESYTLRIRRGRIELFYICMLAAAGAPMGCTTLPGPELWGLPASNGLALRSAVDETVPLHYERVPSNLRAPD